MPGGEGLPTFQRLATLAGTLSGAALYLQLRMLYGCSLPSLFVFYRIGLVVYHCKMAYTCTSPQPSLIRPDAIGAPSPEGEGKRKWNLIWERGQERTKMLSLLKP